MGLEGSTEQGIKTAFKVVTDAYQPADRPAYRCFFLDDESTADNEAREFPCIRITASPNIPRFHGATFRDVRVTVEWMTHRSDDPKCTKLVSLYNDTRVLLDTYTNFTISGYALQGIIIEDSEEPDVTDEEQRLSVTMMVHVCQTA